MSSRGGDQAKWVSTGKPPFSVKEAEQRKAPLWMAGNAFAVFGRSSDHPGNMDACKHLVSRPTMIDG